MGSSHRLRLSKGCCSQFHFWSLNFLLFSTGLQWASHMLVVTAQKNKVCNRWGGSITVSNNKIYYTGGYVRPSKGKVHIEDSLLSVDLSQTWNWDKVTLTEEVATGGASDNDPTPVLLSTKDTLYSFDPSVNASKGLQFQIVDIKAPKNGWRSASFSNQAPDYPGLSEFVYTESKASADGFVIGKPQNTKGTTVVRYNLGTQSLSILSSSPPGLPLNGVLQHIPIGGSGVLVYFGGDSTGNKTMASMQNVHIFDVNSTTWFTQQTTGKAPEFNDGGSILCSAYSAAKDMSSYSIYVFGGDGNVFVLNLPSFSWIQIPPFSNKEPDYQPAPNSDINVSGVGSCAVSSGGRQVVVFGIKAGNDDNVCAAGNGVYIYDMSKLEWLHNFNSSIEDQGYLVPLVITRKIGGDSNGNAQLVRPERGWADSKLAAIFSQTSPSVHNQNGGSPKHGSQVGEGYGGTSTGPNPTKKTSSGAVVGGMLVALVVISLIVCFYILRRRRRRAQLRSLQIKRSDSISSMPKIPPKNESEHPEIIVETVSFPPRKNRISIGRKSEANEYVSPVSPRSMMRTMEKPDHSGFRTPTSTHTHSTLRTEPPISPRTASSRRPYAHSHNSSVMSNHTSELASIPAKLPQIPALTSRRASRAESSAAELEGDYHFPLEKMGDTSFPVEKMDDRMSRIKEYHGGDGESIKDRFVSKDRTSHPAFPEPAMSPTFIDRKADRSSSPQQQRHSSSWATKSISRPTSMANHTHEDVMLEELTRDGVKIEGLKRQTSKRGKAKMVDVKKKRVRVSVDISTASPTARKAEANENPFEDAQ